jgi:hypothetical protein
MQTGPGHPRQAADSSPHRLHSARSGFLFGVVSLLSLLALSQLHAGPSVSLRIEEKALTIVSPASGILDLQVFGRGAAGPMFGHFRFPVFVPATPFVRGQSYEALIHFANGSTSKEVITFGHMDPSVPTVRVSPSPGLIPANTLKLYLDFSEPMEQGVFLNHLRLLKRRGEEVVGAFRETELWSPDGRRLTIMFHPGRQKAGVNLNVDEGPVLTAGEHYRLIVAGRWRSAKSLPLGQEGVFPIQAAAADHEQPDPARWQVRVPHAGTAAALVVVTNELFEPQIFQRALRVVGIPGTSGTRSVGQGRVEWRFTPREVWRPGKYPIEIDPALEDLAGNTLQKPFEVDLTAAPPRPVASTLLFEIAAP